MANSFKETIEFCGKNYKKVIQNLILINFILIVFAVILYFLISNKIIAISPLGVAILYDFFIFTNFNSQKEKMIRERDEEFIQIISYFEIFINNNLNVYQCFRNISLYCSNWMKNQITTMLDEIDKDKTVKPFVNFARKFKAPIVENVMLSIYQMVDLGETNEQLNQFSIFFSQLSKNHQKDLIDKKERSLSSLGTYPLAGTGITTLVITMSILMLMGDIINVF